MKSSTSGGFAALVEWDSGQTGVYYQSVLYAGSEVPKKRPKKVAKDKVMIPPNPEFFGQNLEAERHGKWGSKDGPEPQTPNPKS